MSDIPIPAPAIILVLVWVFVVGVWLGAYWERNRERTPEEEYQQWRIRQLWKHGKVADWKPGDPIPGKDDEEKASKA